MVSCIRTEKSDSAPVEIDKIDTVESAPIAPKDSKDKDIEEPRTNSDVQEVLKCSKDEEVEIGSAPQKTASPTLQAAPIVTTDEPYIKLGRLESVDQKEVLDFIRRFEDLSDRHEGVKMPCLSRIIEPACMYCIYDAMGMKKRPSRTECDRHTICEFMTAIKRHFKSLYQIPNLLAELEAIKYQSTGQSISASQILTYCYEWTKLCEEHRLIIRNSPTHHRNMVDLFVRNLGPVPFTKRVQRAIEVARGPGYRPTGDFQLQSEALDDVKAYVNMCLRSALDYKAHHDQLMGITSAAPSDRTKAKAMKSWEDDSAPPVLSGYHSGAFTATQAPQPVPQSVPPVGHQLRSYVPMYVPSSQPVSTMTYRGPSGPHRDIPMNISLHPKPRELPSHAPHLDARSVIILTTRGFRLFLTMLK
ncbi:hypothetical protein ADUPG1_007971 [Aduncisulcus paluster]|uniref:Uncharacterized protein n=1 Tax=Aduncisulcus paluster TaxID=2918883 RepID=A0ABQ5KQ82_9EUKA|nr:hypothetical protein ADUPG1_007971 [Aduncisulcus paluster]